MKPTNKLNPWIHYPVSLHGKLVNLEPLSVHHFSDLIQLAEDDRIWEFIPIEMKTAEQRQQTLYRAMEEKNKHTQYPFVIVQQSDKKLIGSTRLLDLQPQHKKLEIGWTWLHPDYWGKQHNIEAKLLLLNFCFTALQTIRVQLKTDVNNIRSQKAILKIGATYEGTFRNDWIRENGTIRNSAYYSIIDSEWPQINKHLNKLLQIYHA